MDKRQQYQMKKGWRWQLAQWLEIRWWRRYLRHRQPEEYLAQKITYWQRQLQALDVHLPKGARILDAGCGPAGIFLVLDQQEVVAVDPLLDAYAHLPHFSKAQYPQVDFRAISLEDFTDEQHFDWIFCLNAINHVHDWELALDRLAAALKPGGTLVMGIDVHKYDSLKALFRLVPGDVLHPHQHHRADYRAALELRELQETSTLTWKEGLVFDYWLIVLNKNN